MSELRSIADRFGAESLPALPDVQLEEDFAELHGAIERLERERLRRLAEIDRRGLYERDGHLSAASWLVATFRMSWGAARELVRSARALEEMPVAARALDEAELSLSAVRVLVHARDADPDAFREAEADLVDAARVHTVSDLHRITAYWREAVERERAGDAEGAIRARRSLHASVTFMGMVRIDGDLDPESGETVLTALRAVMDAEARSGADDERTPAQRRADALTEICRQWLDAGERPTVAGERPHVTVMVAADLLRGKAADAPEAPTDDHEGGGEEADASRRGAELRRTCELDHAGPVRPETARRLACDGSLMRIVMSGRSEPLDVGRRTPIVSAAMRRAVIARDRRCRFPGCDRPHTWCDAHHVVHWADGGTTAVPNLALLCRRHHRMVHDGFRLTLEDGRPIFRRPDGSVLEDRAPP